MLPVHRMICQPSSTFGGQWFSNERLTSKRDRQPIHRVRAEPPRFNWSRDPASDDRLAPASPGRKTLAGPGGATKVKLSSPTLWVRVAMTASVACQLEGVRNGRPAGSKPPKYTCTKEGRSRSLMTRGPSASLTPRQQVSTRWPHTDTRLVRCRRATSTAAIPPGKPTVPSLSRHSGWGHRRTAVMRNTAAWQCRG